MQTLYHHWFSAASRKVRMVLGEKRVDVSLRLEKVWERRAEFMALNPAGEVPVLVMDETTYLADQRVIVEYLEETIPEPPLISGDALKRAEIRRIDQWFTVKFESEVTRHLVTEKVMKRFLKMGETNAQAIRAGLHNLADHLDYIDYLTARRHYLAGEIFTLADVSAAAQLSIIDYLGDIDWKAHKGTKDWYARVKSRKCMRGILADRVAGLTPPKHYDKLDF